MHQPAQLQRHIPPVFEQRGPLGAQGRSCVSRRSQEGVNHHRQGGHVDPACHVGEGGAQGGTLTWQQAATETGAGQ